jgi:16S rRNA C1402 N4-methylase RsmH
MPAHYPVMAAEALELLAIRPDGVYVDVTPDWAAIRPDRQAPDGGLLIACDRDPGRSRRGGTPRVGSRIWYRQARRRLRETLARRASRRSMDCWRTWA